VGRRESSVTMESSLFSPTELDSLTRHQSPRPHHPLPPSITAIDEAAPSPAPNAAEISAADSSVSQNSSARLGEPPSVSAAPAVEALAAKSRLASAWESLWLDNKVFRGISHTIFCCVFSSNFIVSVLPRVLVALDVFITVGLMVHFESQRDSIPFDDLLTWLQRSDFDVVLLAVLRAIVLFQCYSYKWHTNFAAVSACWTTSALSALFVCVKVVLLHDYPKRLIFLLTNLSLICIEHALYVMTKRRKIRYAFLGQNSISNVLSFQSGSLLLQN
jgi:hypothetical protein